MGNPQQLITAMAKKCRTVIETSQTVNRDLPEAVHPRHLLWMCDRIERRAKDWPLTRLHRWIGFVQCGMMANGILDLDEIKALFDELRNVWGARGEDLDLLDHMDPGSPFEMDIGGEG